MAQQNPTTRRLFLKAGAATALGAVMPAWNGRTASVPMADRIALGFIGIGDHGTNVNLRTFLGRDDIQVAALCDVDREHLDRARGLVEARYAEERKSGSYRGVFTTGDWREVISRDDVDAVVVSTPDHWHVLPAVAAMRAGKDVMCEKPLSLTVREGRVLSDTARRYGRIFQTASENRSKLNFLQTCGIVRNGRIGTLRRIIVGLPRGIGTSGNYTDFSPVPVPATLDYDMWLGPAPDAPYHPARCHWNFRWIRDYSGGNLTDWGAHMLDIAQWGNNSDTTGPISVEGRATYARHPLYNTPTEWDLVYEYANGVTLICRSGSPSIRFEGTDGWVAVPSWGGTVQTSTPEIAAEPIGPEGVSLRTCPRGEQADFIECIRTRRQTYAPAEIGHRSISVAHIGGIALQLGRKLTWDPTIERFTDDDAANGMLARPMRGPWVL